MHSEIASVRRNGSIVACLIILPYRTQDPHSVSDSVLRIIRDIDDESRLLRDEAKEFASSLKVGPLTGYLLYKLL